MQSVTSKQLVYDEHEGIYLYEGKPYSGLVVHFYNGSVKKNKQELRGGIAWGPGKSWFPNGNIECESDFAGGVTHGRKREWHENGQLAMDAVFELGIEISATKFDEAGNVLDEYVISEESNDFNTLTTLRKHFGELTLPDETPSDGARG